MVANYAFKTYLNYREYKVTLHPKPPVVVKKEITQEQFVKSQNYTRDHLKFSLIRDTSELVKDLAILHFNLLPQIWGLAGKVGSYLGGFKLFSGIFGGVTLQSVLFFAIKKTLELIYVIPRSYYFDFFIEEKWGFNKQTRTKFFRDNLLQIVVVQAFHAAATFIFVKIVDFFGGDFAKYASVAFLVGLLFIQTVVPTIILPLFHKFTPLRDGELRTKIEELAKKNGFPVKKLLEVDGSTTSSHSNAFFTGLPWNKQIVLFDTLIEQHTTEEIVAVLAHELGHWKLGHIWQITALIAALVSGNFLLFTAAFESTPLAVSFGFTGASPIVNLVLFSYLSWPVEFSFQIFHNIVTRKNEYQADNYALKQGYKDELASCLIRMNQKNLSSLDTDWLNSLCTISHPNLVERLQAIGYDPQEKVGNISPEKDRIINNEKEETRELKAVTPE